MKKNRELSAVFRELSLKNQERLLDCARLSRAAENAVKKTLYRDSGEAAGGAGIPPQKGDFYES
jgi:hypothetical protein